jgi:hypothetical protein
MRHITKFRGLNPTHLDRFSTAVTCDLLRKERPDLTFLHLIAYDLIRHRVGSRSEKLERARQSFDTCLGTILDAAGDATVLLFSDHAHLDVHTCVNLDELFGEALLEQCGGSAFFRHPVADIASQPWFERHLTETEMQESGYAARGARSGIAARPGYAFGPGRNRSDHGYPVDYEDYRVFYAVRGKTPPPEPVFGDVRDITAILSKELGLV